MSMKITRRQLRRLIINEVLGDTTKTRKNPGKSPKINQKDIKAVLNIPLFRCVKLLGSLIACDSDYRINHITKDNPSASVLYNLTDEVDRELVDEIIEYAKLWDSTKAELVKTPKFRLFKKLNKDKTAIVEEREWSIYVGRPSNPDVEEKFIRLEFPCVIYPEHGCINGKPVHVYGDKNAKVFKNIYSGDYALVNFGAIKYENEWYYTLPLHLGGPGGKLSPYAKNTGQQSIKSDKVDCGWRDEE